MSAVALQAAARELQEWERSRTMDLWYGNTLVKVPVPRRKPRPLLSPAPRPQKPTRCACGDPVAKNGVRCKHCHKLEGMRRWREAHREEQREYDRRYNAARPEQRRDKCRRAYAVSRNAKKSATVVKLCPCGRSFEDSSRKARCYRCRNARYAGATVACKFGCGRQVPKSRGSCGPCRHYHYNKPRQGLKYVQARERANRLRLREHSAALRRARYEQIRASDPEAYAKLRAKWARAYARRKALRKTARGAS